MSDQSNSLGYLTTSGTKLVYDIKLGFDSTKYARNDLYFKWGEDDKDCITKFDWLDYEMDISDIPPSIFFMGIVNSYSIGFALYIPTDLLLDSFTQKLSKQMPLILSKSNNNTGILCEDYFNNQCIDIEYLNNTGRIKSVAQWNKYHNGKERINCHKGGSWGTIQCIIRDCRLFYKKLCGKL